MSAVFCTMVPESEIKRRPGNNMDCPDSKAEVALKKVQNNYQACLTSYEDCMLELDTYLSEHAREGHVRSAKEADVVKIGHSERNVLMEEKCQDTTECSSSFDDVVGVENDGRLSDGEVVSAFREYDSFNGHGELFRTRHKRLTPQWRMHIQPLMWRCRWIELQIKKLNMQERNYAEEVAKYDVEESSQAERSTTDLCTREVMKRKKRERIEDRSDVTTYMSQHNVFSYYENKKAPAVGICLNDEGRNLENVNCNDEFEIDDPSLWLKSSENNESLEVEFRKIWILKGQISKLRTRLHKVMGVNAGKLI